MTEVQYVACYIWIVIVYFAAVAEKGKSRDTFATVHATRSATCSMLCSKIHVLQHYNMPMLQSVHLAGP